MALVVTRRAYTETQLRTIVLAELRDELGAASAVSGLPPPDGAVEVDKHLGGRVYVGIPTATETVYDGRRDRPVATSTECTYRVRVEHYDRIATMDKEASYTAHLDRRRQIAGRLARMVDAATPPETVPVTRIESRSVWTGQYWAGTVEATVGTRAPTTLP